METSKRKTGGKQIATIEWRVKRKNTSSGKKMGKLYYCFYMFITSDLSSYPFSNATFLGIG
jgi:hypothetical protein